MKIRRIVSFTLPFAALAMMGFTALPARAANINATSLDDGRVHGFSGCLAEAELSASLTRLIRIEAHYLTTFKRACQPATASSAASSSAS